MALAATRLFPYVLSSAQLPSQQARPHLISGLPVSIMVLFFLSSLSIGRRQQFGKALTWVLLALKKYPDVLPRSDGTIQAARGTLSLI